MGRNGDGTVTRTRSKTDSSSTGQFAPEMGGHQLTFGETIEVEFFVGRMGVVVGEGQAQKERVGAKIFFEIVDDGNGAAFTEEHGFMAEGGAQGAQSGLGARAGG